MKQGFTPLALGPLNQLENQKLEKENINYIPRISDLWIPLDFTIPRCCAQFYRPKINDRVKVGDFILKISHIGQATHLLCWIYFKEFYGRLCWRYVGKSDANHDIKIDNNMRKIIDSKKEEEVLAVKDLKHINL
jgi:hypothetical protein